MKKVVFVLATTVMIISCGPSKEEADQQVVDNAVNSVCNCFEKNKEDWLAYKKECNSTIETMRFLIEENPDGLKQFEERIAECDKYHKE